MKRTRSSLVPQSRFEIGFIAMPVLCCLLAASILVWLESTHGREIQNIVDGVAGTLDQSTATLDTETKKFEQLQKEVEAVHLKLATIGDRRRIQDGDERGRLLEEIATLEDELATLTEKIEQLEGRQRKPGEGTGLLLGSYLGDYIVVECLAGEIVIHPGARRQSLKTAGELESLMNLVKKAGFVAILPRPGAWEDDYFTEVRDKLYEQLDALDAQGVRIGRTTLPITAREDINQYLPPRT